MQLKIFVNEISAKLEVDANHWLRLNKVKVLKTEVSGYLLTFPPNQGFSHASEERHTLTIWYE